MYSETGSERLAAKKPEASICSDSRSWSDECKHLKLKKNSLIYWSVYSEVEYLYEDFKEIGLVPNKACLNSVSWIEIQVQDYCHNK